MKDFFKNKKNIIMVCAGVLVLVLVIVLLFVFVFNGTGNAKSKMETELKEMGKDFYENFYYDLVVKDHGKDQISKFKDVGIKVDLDNLERYKSENSDKVKDFVNPKTNESCNKNETKVIIYPEDPYEKTNYRLEVKLSCGFEEK